MKTIAVTGASGFIGRHTLAALEDHDVKVIMVVRKEADVKNIPSRTEIKQMDIYSGRPDLFDKMGRPDTLIHLAWGGLPNYSSLHHFEHELPNQYKFLTNLISGGLSNLLVAGTCFEYGMRCGGLSALDPPAPQNP